MEVWLFCQARNPNQGKLEQVRGAGWVAFWGGLLDSFPVNFAIASLNRWVGSQAIRILAFGAAPLLFVVLIAVPAFADGDGLEAQMLQLNEESDFEAKLELGQALLEVLELAPNEIAETEVRFEMGTALFQLERFGEAQVLLKQAQSLADRTDQQMLLCKSSWELAIIAFRTGEFEYGREQAVGGAQIAHAIDHFDLEWRCWNIKGLIEERLGEYSTALESLGAGLEAAEKCEDPEGTTVVLGSIGIAHMNLGEYEQALEIFLHVRELEIEHGSPTGDPSTIANLGDVSLMLSDVDAAIEYHTEALKLRQAEGSEVELALSYHSLGTIHLLREEYELALDRFEQALELRKRLGLVPEQSASLAGIGVVYARMMENEKAIEAISSSLALTTDLEMFGRRIGGLEALGIAQAQNGDYEAALESYLLARNLEREQRSRETGKRYAEFQSSLQSKEKERQIAVLTADQKLKDAELKHDAVVRQALIGGSVLLFLVGIAGWFAFANLRKTHGALTSANESLSRRGAELEHALSRIKRLEGMLPICSHCKSIRDDAGDWQSLESYLSHRSEATFTHGICPTCVEKHYSHIPG